MGSTDGYKNKAIKKKLIFIKLYVCRFVWAKKRVILLISVQLDKVEQLRFLQKLQLTDY